MTSAAGLSRSQQYVGANSDLGLTNDADLIQQRRRMAQTSQFMQQLAVQDTQEILQQTLAGLNDQDGLGNGTTPGLITLATVVARLMTPPSRVSQHKPMPCPIPTGWPAT
ncbi:MAG: hypothetical protein R2857_10145 [Vampirovibrionales bacterium]